MPDQFDDEALIYQLLHRALPDVQVQPALDISRLKTDDYPIVLFTLTGGNALDESLDIPTAWEYGLDLTVLNEGRSPTRELARSVYNAVRGWNDPWGVPPSGYVEGYGHATGVRDRAVFTRTNQAVVQDKTVAQYDGGFDLQLHAA